MTEGQAPGFWNDIVPKVDADRCQRCVQCPSVQACLAQAFRRKGASCLPQPDQNLCFGCYSCVAACAWGAVLPPKLVG